MVFLGARLIAEHEVPCFRGQASLMGEPQVPAHPAHHLHEPASR